VRFLAALGMTFFNGPFYLRETMARRPTEGPHDELTELIASARMHLEMERSLGAEYLPFSPARVKELRGRRRAALAVNAGAKKAAELEKLRRELESCCRCGLGKGRINLVFGVGRPDADLMFIGEGPGQQEDEQGIPFVGPAGQLLTKIIEAIGLTRDEVYIANIVKCRPPNNRAPLPEESALCLPFLRRQIEIIRPRIIMTLGNVPTQTLLQTTAGITKTRGAFVERDGILFMPTFHPAYLLRDPNKKKEVWEDMKKVWAKMKELGLQVGELKGRK
jgi:uracil-DNA glycosylase family 4